MALPQLRAALVLVLVFVATLLSLVAAQADVMVEHTDTAVHALDSGGEMVGDHHDRWPDDDYDEGIEGELRRQRTKRGELDAVSLLGLLKSRKGGPIEVPATMPELCVRMWMTRIDMVAFYKLLSSRKVTEYLEYGGGGSTLCASQLVGRVTTIEHNKEWCEKLRATLTRSNITNVNLICSPVAWTDPGPKSRHDGRYSEFAQYVDTIHTLGVKKFDVVFIDGRARTACAKAAWRYVNEKSVVGIHDWRRKLPRVGVGPLRAGGPRVPCEGHGPPAEEAKARLTLRPGPSVSERQRG